MSTSIAEHMSGLFRDIESDLGTRDLTRLVAEALITSVTQFKPKHKVDFLRQMRDLIGTVKITKPRIALVIEQFYVVWQVLHEVGDSESSDIETCRRAVLDAVYHLQEKSKQSNESLVHHGIQQICDGETILIHSHSHTVLDVLRFAHSRGKKFHVIVAQQEMEKTYSIIEFLHAHRIPFHVVPEYMLSHIEKDVDKIFIGALTLNSNYCFVVDSGTMSLVSEFHVAKKPVHVFLTTQKFSMWESRQAHHTLKVKSTKIHSHKSISYEHIKFSHDRVPLHLASYIVTEKGVFSHEEIKLMYDAEFSQRREWRKQFFNGLS